MTAENLMTVAGFSAFVLTLCLVRQRALREKYAILWLSLGLFLAVLGMFPGVIKWFAHAFHLAYPTAVLFGALSVIFLFSIGISISISRHHRHITSLLQDLAILRSKVVELERRDHGRNDET